MRKILPYIEYGSVTSAATAGTLGTQVYYNLNSLFAVSAAGHQPYGFNTLETLYRRYKVDRVDVAIKFIAYDTSTIHMQALAMIIPPNATYTTSAVTLAVALEKPMTATAVIDPASAHTTAVIRQSFPMYELIGVTKAQFDANVEDYQALCTASPARVPTLLVNVANLSSAVATAIKTEVTLMFHCEFFERVILSQSA